MATSPVNVNPYANAHTQSDMRKVSDKLMKEYQKPNDQNQTKQTQTTKNTDYSLNISDKAKQKASEVKENPYATAGHTRRVSESPIKSYSNKNAAEMIK